MELKALISRYWKEWLTLTIFYLLVFLAYTFDKDEPRIEEYQAMFFLNYALAAGLISYLLLPRFFYKKNYLAFATGVVLVLAGVILVEELVLEKIYFPDTRGRVFYDVFFTLMQVLPPVFILSSFKFAWDAVHKQRELESLQAVMRESELQFLTSQINPHFLFNNLNNLYAYAVEESPKTPGIILELSSVLRYMLYECKEKHVPLVKEVHQLENFIRLSEHQIEERGQVSYDFSRDLEGLRIAPLILVVFIENAFKHSQASQSEGILIDVDLKVASGGKLDFRCRNSFREQGNTQSLSKGIGLANVKKRLELLYPQAHELKISQEAGMYEVSLSLDLHRVPA